MLFITVYVGMDGEVVDTQKANDTAAARVRLQARKDFCSQLRQASPCIKLTGKVLV